MCACTAHVWTFLWELTKTDALELCPLSLDRLFDYSLSGAMETTLPTFDPIHELNLLDFGIKSVEIPEERQKTR